MDPFKPKNEINNSLQTQEIPHSGPRPRKWQEFKKEQNLLNFSSEEENTFKPSEIKQKEDNANRKSIENILGMFVGRKSKAMLDQHLESMEMSNEKRTDS